LYRGLKTPYRPERVGADSLYSGTDFTDCPFTALQYASTPCGVVLVLEVPAGAPLRISEELWVGPRARRLMVWGRFDQLVARIVPAKELRAQVRRKGVVGQGDAYKSSVLARYIDLLPRDGRLPVAEARLAPR
jgi:hypothetical protein